MRFLARIIIFAPFIRNILSISYVKQFDQNGQIEENKVIKTIISNI